MTAPLGEWPPNSWPPLADCRRCGAREHEIVSVSLPDQPQGGLALRNLLGVAPPDAWRWSVVECSRCGHLELFREPQAESDARVREHLAHQAALRRELAALEAGR